jgi:hypothetical protein
MTIEDLEAQYGPPDAAYQADYCTIWEVKQDFPWFPAERVFINKDFKNMLFASFTAVQSANLQHEIAHFDGCFNIRDVRGAAGKPSAHSYAAAMDLNASKNRMVVNPTPAQRLGSWSQEFITAMQSSGVFFGGNFIRRADPMHFSMLDA